MKIKNMILNIVIGALCFIFVVSTFYMIREIVSYNTSYHVEESNFLYSIQQQDYASLVEMMYLNEAADVETNNTYEECYAVARYYEAATYYKAYKNAGDDKAAGEKLEIMKEQMLLMGDLAYVAEEINEELEL